MYRLSRTTYSVLSPCFTGSASRTPGGAPCAPAASHRASSATQRAPTLSPRKITASGPNPLGMSAYATQHVCARPSAAHAWRGSASAIVAAARRTGSDAIHPGYGFLAENAAFARACGKAGITFVGPSPDAIEAMGSKLEAKRRMEGAGVPVVPGGDVTGLDGADLQAAAERVGFPLLAKASAGGGGGSQSVSVDALSRRSASPIL